MEIIIAVYNNKQHTNNWHVKGQEDALQYGEFERKICLTFMKIMQK